jgi:hypothetical protein
MTELEQLREDKAMLDWLERFLQLGGSSIFAGSSGQAHVDRPDDTESTRWNRPLSIGYEIEVEHRGCYRWEELSNGAKGIRPAIAAARASYEEQQRLRQPTA